VSAVRVGGANHTQQHHGSVHAPSSIGLGSFTGCMSISVSVESCIDSSTAVIMSDYGIHLVPSTPVSMQCGILARSWLCLTASFLALHNSDMPLHSASHDGMSPNPFSF